MDLSLEQFGIDRLSPHQRLGLIQLIWDSLPDDATWMVPESHRRELALRLDAADADPGAVEPWEQVLARLLRKG